MERQPPHYFGSMPPIEPHIRQPGRGLAINDLLNHPSPSVQQMGTQHPVPRVDRIPTYPQAAWYATLNTARPEYPRIPTQDLRDRYRLPPPHNPYLQAASQPAPAEDFEGLRLPSFQIGARGNSTPIVGRPDPSVSAVQDLGRRTFPTNSRPRKSCMICLEIYFGIETENQFPHKCHRCEKSAFCISCLKEWFIDACKNESKMPPKCCSIIPLSTVSNLLKKEQIEFYKLKYEEWSTADRLYCPVPTCSTFIPRRLLVQPAPITRETYPFDRESRRSVSNGDTQATTEPFRRPRPGNFDPIESKYLVLSTKPTKSIQPQVSCPTCRCLICTKCRSYAHGGECPKSDIDPELEEQFKKWKIKRCPKCRSGVRKMFGCAHIECRCGAHFCWECLLPINLCDGQCEDDSEGETDGDSYNDEDLDDHARFRGDGMAEDFGEEPYGAIIDTWACAHDFLPYRKPTTILSEGRSQMSSLECQHCFRTVKAAEPKELAPSEDIEMTGMSTELGWPTNFWGEPSWRCEAGHLICNRCPKNAPRHRRGQENWKWLCDCGTVCEQCDRAQAIERRKKDAEMAWECRCGMLVCGACKDSALL